MAKDSFEELIRNNETAICQARDVFFPLIREGVITGYNLYDRLFDYHDGKLFLNYLHSDLSAEHKHYQELMKIFEKEGIVDRVLSINHELIGSNAIHERDAVYLTRAEWEDSPRMRYFLFDGTEIPADRAKTIGIDVIGEVVQYDMLLKVKDEYELRGAIRLLKKHVAKFKINRQGNKIRDHKGKCLKNCDAIHNAWDIPLLVCTCTSNRKPKGMQDFLRVSRFDIAYRLGQTPVTISTIVRRKTEDLRRFLRKEGFDFEVNKKYVLRTFVEEYILS